MEDARTRGITLPNNLWERIRKATGKEQAETGQYTSINAWVRREIEKALTRTETEQPKQEAN